MNILLPLFIVSTLFVASGCSVLEKIETSPISSRLITNQITLRIIAGADDPVARAGRIKTVVGNVRSKLTTSGTYTLAELEAVVREEINWDALSLADQDLLNEGLLLARRSISDLIGEGVVEPDEEYTVSTLLRWVEQASDRVQ